MALWLARTDFRPKAANPFSYMIGLVTALLFWLSTMIKPSYTANKNWASSSRNCFVFFLTAVCSKIAALKNVNRMTSERVTVAIHFQFHNRVQDNQLCTQNVNCNEGQFLLEKNLARVKAKPEWLATKIKSAAQETLNNLWITDIIGCWRDYLHFLYSVLQ